MTRERVQPPALRAPEDNQSVYGTPDVVSCYTADGWSDPGEAASYAALADLCRGEPLLDIGVGGGRTTRLLRLVSADYTGVDYAPDMVELARSRHPGANLLVEDARTLALFPAARFAAVTFSYNGIDSVGHEDRARVFASVRRVLRPGGCFAYSTLNRHGGLYGARPWRDLTPGPWPATGPARARFLFEVAVRLLAGLSVAGDWRRARTSQQDHGDWALSLLRTHRFRLLNHFVTLDAARREAAQAGFEVLGVWSPSAERLDDAADSRDDWFHLLLRARAN